jgi:hypothetical protein
MLKAGISGNFYSFSAGPAAFYIAAFRGLCFFKAVSRRGFP